MRRTIAIALAVGLLFAGGCGRQERRAQRDQQPAAVSTRTQDAPAQDTSASTNTTDDGDVDQLLDQVDQQLSGDAQPADDDD